MAEASVRVRFGDNKVSTNLRLQNDDCPSLETKIMGLMLQPVPKALMMEHEPAAEVSVE